MSTLIVMEGKRKVRFTREAIALFNAQWPCSTLRATRSYWFEFDLKGDLVDTDVPEQDDGNAARALSDDAKAYLFDDVTPPWMQDADGDMTQSERDAYNGKQTIGI